jgi:hypothetical protein
LPIGKGEWIMCRREKKDTSIARKVSRKFFENIFDDKIRNRVLRKLEEITRNVRSRALAY